MSFFDRKSIILSVVINIFSSKFKNSLHYVNKHVFSYFSQQDYKKRASLFISPYEAALSVEAAFIFPLFLSVCISLMFFGELFRLQTKVNEALFNCGKVYAQYGGLLAKREVENNVLLKAGISGIGIYEANSYLIKSLGEDYINNSILANGKSSFSLYNSSISSEYIDLIVSYKVKFKVPFVELPVIPIVQRCRFHTWSGKNVKENSNTDTIVYITPTGSVYHKSQSCTYLRLSISKVLFDNVKNLRNDSGGKYYPCERCLKKEAADESVYISKTGSKYHKNLDCSELKRTVISVELETVKDSKKACNRCAN